MHGGCLMHISYSYLIFQLQVYTTVHHQLYYINITFFGSIKDSSPSLLIGNINKR